MQKQSKKKLKTAILSVLLVGVMVATGIGAYFTATDTKTNVFTVGNVDIELQEPNWQNNYPTTPNETVKKDPQIKNIGDQDAYVYLTVDVPYATVVVADADGNKSAAAETELFSYTVNDNWVEVGTAEQVTADSVYRHVYAYVGSDATTLEALAATATTSALFEEIKFANVVETADTAVLADTNLDVVINAYGIETNIIGSEATAEYVWSVITNQVIDAAIVPVTAKDAEGNNLNASATNITGKQSDELLASLEKANLATADEVDALIEVKSDDFDGLAETTFDVSNIAKEGDQVVILHYNEETKEWEYVSTETVNEDNKIITDMSSYSPIAFLVIDSNENDENLAPGLYDENDVLMYDWDTLVNTYGIDIEKDYVDSDGNLLIMNPRDIPGVRLSLNDDLSKGSKLIIDDSVTRIGNASFMMSTTLKEVVIPNSITSIGDGAFSGTGLTSIVIPDSVTSIGKYAFQSCENLTSITIPDSVISIDDGAFQYCESLTSITIPDSVTSIDDIVFSGCYNLTSITIPDSVTSIGWSAFDSCSSLTSITIPVSVTKIGDYAFYDCINLSIIVPNNVTTIGEDAFQNVHCVCYNGNADGKSWGAKNIHMDKNEDYICDVCNISLPNGIVYYSDGTYKTWTTLINEGIVTNTEIPENAFKGSNVTKVILPNSLSKIGANAFGDCFGIKEFIINDNIESVGHGVLWGLKDYVVTWKGVSYTKDDRVVFNQALKDAGVASEDAWIVPM